MAVKDLTLSQIQSMDGERHALSGVYSPAIDEFANSYEWRRNAVYHLGQASFGHLQVRKDDASATTIRIMPGRAMWAGSVRTYAGGTLDLAAYNNDTAYVYAAAGGSGLLTVAAVADGTGWPTTAHVKLAEVALAAGSFEETAIVDRRPERLFWLLANIAKLNQSTSNPPTQAQVQAIANKIDALIDALVGAGIMSAS